MSYLIYGRYCPNLISSWAIMQVGAMQLIGERSE